MQKDTTNTMPFGEDTMANLPVDYSFREYHRQQAEARREAEAQAVALAAAQAMEDELSDTESLEAIQSFMEEEELERRSEERVNRLANGILSRIAGQPAEELQQRTVSQRPYETSQQYIPPVLDEDEEPEPKYAPLWLYWAIGVTACLVMLALIYIVSR